MFSKLFKKHKKELKDSIEFKYDDKAVNVFINLEDVSQEVQSFLELIIEELEDEGVAQFIDNVLMIPHKSVYQISEDYLSIFSFPKYFHGSVEVDLKGLINQGDGEFIINLFNESKTKIIPYKVVGTILHIIPSATNLTS